MNRIKNILIINLIFAVLFSVMNINFSIDVSVFAFVIGIVFTGIFGYFSFKFIIKETVYGKIAIVKKFLQYEPYVMLLAFICRRAGKEGTVYIFDLISVIFWLGVFATSCLLQFYMSPKKFKKLTGKELQEKKNSYSASILKTKKQKENNRTFGQWLGFELLDWVDALVQAVFMVLIFQIFLFQFYKIPTESMVPEFMVNDRVAVTKLVAGPKFPLSDVGLPCFKNYNRGDIVVFRNPHYTIDRNSEVKTVISQLLYMLTFTTVNTNKDENGRLKADPLVKRITAVGGEQIFMQDGKLYSRTKDSNEFKEVADDSKWAAYNLNKESPALKKYIQEYPVEQPIFDALELTEETRRSLNLADIKDECISISNQFYNLTNGSHGYDSEEIRKMYAPSDLWEIMLYRDNFMFTQALLSNPKGSRWFELFMTDWISNSKVDFNSNGLKDSNLYEDACFKLNLMFKAAFGNAVLRNAKLIYSGAKSVQIDQDEELAGYIEQLRNLHNYICFMDRRNMPVFPPNKEDGSADYIPEDCFFMMGDNRFNSFDMRHCDNEYMRKITELDEYSMTYYSNMAPQYVPKKLILGATGIRFWPLSRSGRTGNSAR